MTAEVCIMNRLAVVLAADSATTVTAWTESGREERYFKGANKIFQLSDFHPVGMMIFDSADFLRVPWEIVVKEFRHKLARTSFPTIADYASEFFKFLDDNDRLFPPAIQKEIFVDAARTAAIRFVLQGPDKQEGASGEEATQLVDVRLAEHRKAFDETKAHPCIPQEKIATLIQQWRDEIAAALDEFRPHFDQPFPSDSSALAEAGLIQVCKNPKNLANTGIVFAGFGEDDIFPQLRGYAAYGIVEGKHISDETMSRSVNHENPAVLESFAQTSMSDTFSIGISEDVYSSIGRCASRGLGEFANTIVERACGNPIAKDDLDGLISDAAASIRNEIMQQARTDHAVPLRRVLAVLPVDEMAELAETLINLQSLKEKVTKPSETVGGPVDVAILTRGEGLVWAKRKHFFDPKLNSRFFLRQRALYERNA